MYSRHKSSSKSIHCKYFLPICCLHLHFTKGVLMSTAEILTFYEIQFIIFFSFMVTGFGNLCKNVFEITASEIFPNDSSFKCKSMVDVKITFAW